MTAVTPTDRPKSARNRCVIKVLVVFVRCSLVFEFSVGIGGFVKGLGQISLFFSLELCPRSFNHDNNGPFDETCMDV